jgi:acetoacetyl-[acyl-carrier protein] synthase
LTQALGRQEKTQETADAYDQVADSGEVAPIYRFGEGVLEGDDLDITDSAIKVPGFAHSIDLDLDNPFEDMS